MASKVIRLPLKKKAPTLSRLMIIALVEASAKQMLGIPFGPADIKGSFSFLIERGLIICEEVSLHHPQSVWQVTPEAMNMLRNLGAYR